MNNETVNLVEPGHFVVGCNYWASHAGTQMWSDWQPKIVARDLRRLRAGGMQVVRVFPLWPDFQPLTVLRTGHAIVEYRHGEAPLPDDACGQAGLSATALERFARFLDLAEQNGLRCIVGLVTGWMSGRLFVPPAFEGLNVLTDPSVIRWQVRFVHHFVTRFRGHPALASWDLGNECNCMGPANREQAYVWAATMANAIRAADPGGLVISGMHGLSPSGNWSLFDQGELTDLLTVHPYPVFTPYCDQDPVNTIRTALHSTAEARYYADLGGKPCLCEEVGTLGPVVASDAVAAAFARTSLYSLWANDCHGMLWWCAHDQTHLEHAPYDWCAVERELGLFRGNGSAKPLVKEFTDFRRFLAKAPAAPLPQRVREAVCILTEDQDHWGVAYSTFVLAKQAGFDVEFQHASQPLREAALYLLPSLKGYRMMDRHRLKILLERVKAGATLYVSLDDGMPGEFEALIGLEPQTREKRVGALPIVVDGIKGCPSIPGDGSYKIQYRPTRATVLGREADGNPAFTVAAYGKGKVFFLSVPMEMTLTRTTGAFHAEAALPCWKLYRHIAEPLIARRAVGKSNPLLAITEHPVSRTETLIVVINHAPAQIRETLSLGRGWALERLYRGNVKAGDVSVNLVLPPNDVCVFTVKGKK